MTDWIETSEAKAQNLSGFDTYLASHLIYKDEENLSWLCANLRIEAYKFFSDTITFNNFLEIKKNAIEFQKFIKSGGLITDPFAPKISPMRWRMMDHIRLENFKISTGLELLIKAIMAGEKLVIHEIDRTAQHAEQLRK